MKKLLAIIIIVSVCLLCATVLAEQDSLLGTWFVTEGYLYENGVSEHLTPDGEFMVYQIESDQARGFSFSSEENYIEAITSGEMYYSTLMRDGNSFTDEYGNCITAELDGQNLLLSSGLVLKNNQISDGMTLVLQKYLSADDISQVYDNITFTSNKTTKRVFGSPISDSFIFIDKDGSLIMTGPENSMALTQDVISLEAVETDKGQLIFAITKDHKLWYYLGSARKSGILPNVSNVKQICIETTDRDNNRGYLYILFENGEVAFLSWATALDGLCFYNSYMQLSAACEKGLIGESELPADRSSKAAGEDDVLVTPLKNLYLRIYELNHDQLKQTDWAKYSHICLQNGALNLVTVNGTIHSCESSALNDMPLKQIENRNVSKVVEYGSNVFVLYSNGDIIMYSQQDGQVSFNGYSIVDMCRGYYLHTLVFLTQDGNLYAININSDSLEPICISQGVVDFFCDQFATFCLYNNGVVGRFFCDRLENPEIKYYVPPYTVLESYFSDESKEIIQNAEQKFIPFYVNGKVVFAPHQATGNWEKPATFLYEGIPVVLNSKGHVSTINYKTNDPKQLLEDKILIAIDKVKNANEKLDRWINEGTRSEQDLAKQREYIEKYNTDLQALLDEYRSLYGVEFIP